MPVVRLRNMTTNTSSPNTPDPHNTKKSFNPKKCRLQYDDRKYIDRGQLYTADTKFEIGSLRDC